MTLQKLYTLVNESTSPEIDISDRVISLQRKISFAARKCYQTHLNGSLFTKKEYSEKLTAAWAKFNTLKQQYIQLINSHENEILMDSDLVQKIKRFKEKHPQIFS